MIKAQGSSVTHSKLGTSMQVSVTGTIDESWMLESIDMTGCTKLQVNCAGIDYINSIGVRRFIKWTWGIEKDHPQMEIVLQKLPPTVTRQLVGVRTHLPHKMSVASVLVPFYCHNCEADDQSAWITSATVAAAPSLDKVPLPIVVCSTCKEPMEMDGDPKQLFLLLKERNEW